jgi:hypothetical protein
MAAYAVNVTDFSRGLSEYLNNVQYKGMVLDIERGKRIVARLSPAGQADGFPIGQLDDLLGKGPQLSSADRQAMVTDVRAVRAQLRTKVDPWA